MKWTKLALRVLGYVFGLSSCLIVVNLSKFPMETRYHWHLAVYILSVLMVVSFASIYIISTIQMLKNR